MNRSVFSREVRDDLTFTLIWTAILLLGSLANVLSAVLPLRSSGAPYDVAAALAGQTSNTIYLGPIFAMILGSLVISREEDEKTIEFLLAHPLTRVEIAVSKLLAYTVCVLFLNLVLLAVGFVLIATLGPSTGHSVAAYLSLCLSTFLLMYAFGAAGMFLSMFVVKGGAVVGYSIGIPLFLLLLFLLQSAGSELLRTLSRLSPYRYLDVAKIMASASVDLPFVLITAAVSGAFLAASVALYRTRQFPA